MRDGSLKLAVEFLGGRAAAEKILKCLADPGNLFRRFMHKLEAEVANSSREPGRQVRTGLLRFGSENRIAAADVSHHGMRSSSGIPQRDLVALAGASAILVASAGGEKPAEDAMFGVEDRQVVIGDNL